MQIIGWFVIVVMLMRIDNSNYYFISYLHTQTSQLNLWYGHDLPAQ